MAQIFLNFLKPKLIIMKDNFVKVFRMAGLGKLVMVCLVFVGATVFNTLSAQYMGKQQAISVLEAKATSVSQAISNLPTQSVDYRYGEFQIFTYKAIYAKIQDSNTTVADAVESVFGTMSEKTDRMSEYHTTMVEYNKKYQVSNFDLYYAIKSHIKSLLKG